MAPRNFVFALLAILALSSNAMAEETGACSSRKTSSIGPARWYKSNGWANGGHQGCTWNEKNVTLSEHAAELLLTDVKLKDRPFSCAELQTRQYYSYGTYEVRIVRRRDRPQQRILHIYGSTIWRANPSH